MSLEENVAIRPQDLILSQEELSRLAQLEIEIDEQLKQRFKPSNPRTEVLIGTLPEHLHDEIIRRYNESGWSKVERGWSDHHLSFRM